LKFIHHQHQYFTSVPKKKKKKKKNFIVKEKKAMKVMMNIDRQSTDDAEDTFVTAETIIEALLTSYDDEKR
jgi:hypothetical protein